VVVGWGRVEFDLRRELDSCERVVELFGGAWGEEGGSFGEGNGVFISCEVNLTRVED